MIITNRSKKGIRTLAATLAAVMAVALVPVCLPSYQVSAESNEAFSATDGEGYASYIAEFEDAHISGADIAVDVTAVTQTTETVGERPAITVKEGDTILFPVEVEESGLYYIFPDYYNGVPTGALQIGVTVDGKTPFDEASGIALGRQYADITGIVQDASGADIRPKSEATQVWLSAALQDSSGLFDPALAFYLEAGAHTIGITNLQGDLILGKLTLKTSVDLPKTYEEYRAHYDSLGTQEADGVLNNGMLTLQAENIYRKSDISLYPQSDVSSPMTTPFEYGKERLNAIGGTKWQVAHQWISWKVDVPQSGYYRLGLRFRQNVSKGLPVTRSLYIDGKVPFTEASKLTFAFDNSWQGSYLSIDDEPCLFYLPEGSVELRMEVTLGEAAPLIVRAMALVEELQSASRQLLTLLSTDPDLNRDYRIEEYMPEVIELFDRVSPQLSKLALDWEAVTGERDTLHAQIDQMVYLLENMTEDPAVIPKNFQYYRDSLSNLASQIIYSQQQPLMLDCLYVAEADTELPRVEVNFWERLVFSVKRFIYSYITDYDTIGSSGDYDKNIEVWLGNSVDGGRDQARILRQIINEDFSPLNDIAVELRLVPAGTIQTAMMSGRGPDVALQLGAGDPVEYAARNAVYDLSKFDGYEEIVKRFPKAALEGYTFNGGVYALPQAINYPVMIYRSDILEELGIDVNTLNSWDDIAGVMPTLQMHNIDIGLQATINTYYTFLYQMGGQVYTENRDATQMDERTNLDAFAKMMQYYTDEGLPYSFSFENRLRTGEMALGIVDIGTYNLLQISAPEIKGKWAMRTVPGIVGEDGTVNNAVPLSATGAVIMRSAEDKDSCWEFLCWLTDAEAQYQYGMELESTLGSGARYNTANLEAMELLPWKTAEVNSLKAQIDVSSGVIQVPGSYMVTRNIEFAIKNVYNTREDARQALRGYVEQMNTEIARKRRDLNLD